MFESDDIFELSSGTVCHVHWTRPETEVNSEKEKNMREFAAAWFDIVTEECENFLNTGKNDLAKKRWQEADIDFLPKWFNDT